jgi:hypothetical protein
VALALQAALRPAAEPAQVPMAVARVPMAAGQEPMAARLPQRVATRVAPKGQPMAAVPTEG